MKVTGVVTGHNPVMKDELFYTVYLRPAISQRNQSFFQQQKEGNMSTNEKLSKRRSFFTSFPGFTKTIEDVSSGDTSHDPQEPLSSEERRSDAKPANQNRTELKPKPPMRQEMTSKTERVPLENDPPPASMFGPPASGPTGLRDDKDVAPSKSQKPRFLEMLVQKNVIDEEAAERILAIQRDSKDKRRLVDILISDIGIDQDVVFRSVARYYSFDVVDPTPVFGNREKLHFIKQTLSMLPPYYYEMAVRQKILPYEFYTNGYDKLILVTPDTTHPDVHAVARAFQFQKYEIKSVSLADWNELWRQLAFDQDRKSVV
jgi:hypothetical protein